MGPRSNTRVIYSNGAHHATSAAGKALRRPRPAQGRCPDHAGLDAGIQGCPVAGAIQMQHLLFGVIGAADQGTGFNVTKTERFTPLLVLGKLRRGHPSVDGQVLARGL